MQKVIRPIYLIGILLAILATAAFFISYTQEVFGAQTSDQSTKLEHHYIQHTFFSATTTSATSTQDSTEDPNSVGMDIKGAKKVTMLFTHGGAATTSTTGATFKVEVSPDGGSTWHTFNRLLGSDVSQTATSSVTIQAATSTVWASLDLVNTAFDRLRCISTELVAPLGTDGEQTCKAIAEF